MVLLVWSSSARQWLIDHRASDMRYKIAINKSTRAPKTEPLKLKKPASSPACPGRVHAAVGGLGALQTTFGKLQTVTGIANCKL